MSKELPQQPQQSEELDLGSLFKLIGKLFNDLFSFVGGILNNLFLAFVWIVFFTKKHLIKLVIAGILGFGFGFVLEKVSIPVYRSSITVKQNFQTGGNLFNTINYYNELVGQKDINTLSRVLDIDSASASSILAFDMEAVVSGNDKIKDYDAYLKALDSTIAQTIGFESYIENEEDYQHPFQQITIRSKERNNFRTVFEQIVNNVNTNEYFMGVQRRDTTELFNRKRILENAMVSSDSLMSVYKKVLTLGKEEQTSQTRITFKNSDDDNKTREYDLFLNNLQLQREIVGLEREIDNKRHIIEVISGHQESGSIDNKKEIFGLEIGYKRFYGLLFALLTFVGLLGIKFIKFLEKFKSKIE